MDRAGAGDSSRAGHVQSCLNTGGPPSKPKYSSATDSAQVPWGKGEKHPDEGSETVPETGYLQTVGGRSPKVSGGDQLSVNGERKAPQPSDHRLSVTDTAARLRRAADGVPFVCDRRRRSESESEQGC